MAGKISELNPLAAGDIANDDLFEVVDVDDFSLSSSGTNKKMLWSSIKSALGLGFTNINANVTSPVIANFFGDVTGLSFAVTSGRLYHFRFCIPYNASATTNGSKWSINGPATTLLAYTSSYVSSATANVVNNLSAYNGPATTSTDSLLTGNVAIIEGFVEPSASGTIIARFASEGASPITITALAGAFVEYREVI